MSLPRNIAVIIVDDEADMRAIIADCCRQAIPHVRIVEASNGSEALTKINRQKFDLLITDIKMPRVDGKTMIEIIRKMDFALQPRNVIIVSGFLSEENLPVTFESLSCISKPFDREVFVRLIQRALNGQKPSADKPAPVKAPVPPSSASGALAAASGAKADVSFINPFIAATLEVISTSGNTRAEKDQIYLRSPGQVSGDISGVVVVASDQLSGSMAISFEEKCFIHLVENMMGRKVDKITPEIEGAAGELCNQILGLAKRALNEKGHSIKSAIPSVITGARHTVKHAAAGPCIAVRFRTPGGAFVIEAVVQAKPGVQENAA